jgi:hypothetical protein
MLLEIKAGRCGVGYVKHIPIQDNTGYPENAGAGLERLDIFASETGDCLKIDFGVAGNNFANAIN